MTYAKLADFMDGQNPEMLAAYRKGDFARAGDPGVECGGTRRRKRTGRCDGCPIAAAREGGRPRLAFNAG